jgi:hypothetical protein
MGVSVKDGSIVIGDKKFVVDSTLAPKGESSKPLNLMKSFGMAEPLYFLKWDCIFPARVNSKVVERRVDIEAAKNIVLGNPSFPVERNIITNVVFTRDAKNTPESLYKTESLKILGGMLRVKRQIGGGALPLIFGVVVGAVISFLLMYFKLIRI